MPRKPSDYSKLVIYKIQHIDNPEMLYVGSTTDFTKRKNHHKHSCNNPNKKIYNFKLYQMIRENGNWDMFNMVVIKPFLCQNKQEALTEEDRCMREMKANMNERRAYVTPEERVELRKQHYTENKDKIAEREKQYYTVNKDKITERTKQYILENKDKIAEQTKQYRLEHKDKIAERLKQYRLENKDKIKQYRLDNKEQIAEKKQQYYLKHKDKIAEREKQKIICDCGCIISQNNLPRHKRSLKHQDLMNSSKVEINNI